MLKWIGRVGILMMLGLLTNCASITTGTDQEIEISSEPVGAKCVVEQDGRLVASIQKTPETVTVDKSWSDLFVTCDKAGHLTDITSVGSEFQGATLGNFILGGGIGLIIDASNGAMRKYPDKHMVFMVPDDFATKEEAEVFFEGLVTKITDRNEQQFSETKKHCIDQTPDNKSDCESKVEKMEKALQDSLAKIEASRQKIMNKFTS